jgi:hypothetical protein
MAVSNTGTACAAAFGGGSAAKPVEDNPEVAAIFAATEAKSDTGTREFSRNATTGVITVGLVDITGEQDHTSKWTPTGGANGTTGTWDGLQRR